MSSIAEISETLTAILNEKANDLARKTSFLKRERAFSGADFAQSLIFGWLQEPDISLAGLCQVFGRREVAISASGLHQRMTPESAEFMGCVLDEVSSQQMKAEEEVPTKLLKQFEAVILEDSSVIGLPKELSSIWQGCGGHPGASQAGVKLYVRWDVLGGHLNGPWLTDAKTSDRQGPFEGEPIPPGSLYLADLGFFGLEHLSDLMRRQGRRKGYVITRFLSRTALYTRRGHRLELRGVLPAQVGEAREIGVLVGQTARLPMRLILIRVPREVGDQRRQQMIEDAKDHGRVPTQETLFLADWTLLLTNVPRRMLGVSEVLVLMRLRWQIERLFRLWKEVSRIDEWRSKKPYRILTELYAKLCAMVIQQWLLHQGCWADPHRSLFLAARLLQRESNRLMIALYEDRLLPVVTAVIEQLRRFGGKVTRRKARPGTDQLLEEGLDWAITVLS
jgi:hypothetical protein